METITEFQGVHRWLSNFWLCPIVVDGVEYGSVEHAYQASKCVYAADRQRILTMTPGQAKRFVRTVPTDPYFEGGKLALMHDLLRQKFQDPDLRHKLLATRGALLTEGNTWHDTYWGQCTCGRCPQGHNWLGVLLMDLRTELQEA
jgi:ribA/ribD-fused uncharacterized protein